MVLISRLELQHLRDELDDLGQRLEVLAKKRFDVRLLLTRLDGVLRTASDPDKTPVRPPSSDQVRGAYAASAEYVPPRTGETKRQSFEIPPPIPREEPE